jgi:hypothetical protein
MTGGFGYLQNTSVSTMLLLTLFLLSLLHFVATKSSASPSPLPTTSTKTYYHSSTGSSSSSSSSSISAWPLNQYARKAIQNAESYFKNVEPIVDPNSNKDTQNQKSIYIAKDFLNHVGSTAFMNHEVLSNDEDRLVKIGRSVVDLVQMAGVGGDGKDGTGGGEDELRLGLQVVVESCDILASDDLKVRKIINANYFGGVYHTF